jgi:hypothetical protein
MGKTRKTEHNVQVVNIAALCFVGAVVISLGTAYSNRILWGHAMAHVVSCQSLSVEVWLRVRTSLYGICGQGGEVEQFVLQVLLFSSVSISPPVLCSPTLACNLCYIIS